MTTTLESSVKAFVEATKVIRYFDSPYKPSFTTFETEQLEFLSEKLPISNEVLIWYRLAAPVVVDIPWIVEYLRLYNPLTLIEYQIGYRWLYNPYHYEVIRQWQDELTSGDAGEFPNLDLAETNKWHPTWLVIADASTDPFIAHTDQPGTPISYATHGLGSWSPKLISPNLTSYFRILTAWIDVAIGKYDLEIVNEELETLPEVLEDLDTAFSDILPDEHRMNLMGFIKGDY